MSLPSSPRVKCSSSSGSSYVTPSFLYTNVKKLDNDPSSGPRDENRRRRRARDFHANDFGGVLDDYDDVSRAAASNARVQTPQLSKCIYIFSKLLNTVIYTHKELVYFNSTLFPRRKY
uniref:Uncharacterized protein n=1 Tax=Trichogramma kaykai TaxID=54128 RepID=A0ABD2X590_9HYME